MKDFLTPNERRFLNRRLMQANPRKYARVLRSVLFAGLIR